MRYKIAALTGALAILVGVYATPLMAFGLGIGGTLGGAHVEASGQEYMNVGDANVVTAGHKMNKDAFLPLGAAHVEIIIGDSYFGEHNGFALGIEHVFGEGNIEHVKNQGTRSNIANLATEGSASGAITAKVKLKSLNSVYLETPGFTPLGIFLKAGFSTMDIITEETVYTGAAYGNGSIDGHTWGIGFKKAAESGLQMKVEFNWTDWDTITLNNAGSGDLGANKITATPDQRSASVGLAYIF